MLWYLASGRRSAPARQLVRSLGLRGRRVIADIGAGTGAAGPRRDAETSMLKTLAAKHKSTVGKVAARHTAKIQTPHGLRTCFEAKIARDGKQPLVARFGGIPLKRDRNAVPADRAPGPVLYPRKELIRRLLRAGASCAATRAR